MFSRAKELKSENYTNQGITDILNEEFETSLTVMAIQKKFYNENKRKSGGSLRPSMNTIVNKNGTMTSTTVIAMKKEQTKDVDFVLRAHGFKPEEWKLKQVTDNFWQQNNTVEGLVDLYQTKIVVEPLLDQDLKLGEAIDRLRNEIQPIKPIELEKKGDGYLVVPLFDLHFGQSSIADYQETLSKVLSQLAIGYKKVVIIAGGDILHNDTHQGTTSSGTVIDKVDMTKAWDMAFDYLFTLITTSLQNSVETEVLYVPGNHDEITGQTVIKALERVFNDNRVSFDSNQEVFKATLLGHNFIGATHGHKSTVKKYPMIYATGFSYLWGAENVITRELFTGHLHHELWGDLNGLFFRQAPTRKKLDQYHKDNGFSSAHSRFQLVEYSEYEPTAVYYV